MTKTSYSGTGSDRFLKAKNYISAFIHLRHFLIHISAEHCPIAMAEKLIFQSIVVKYSDCQFSDKIHSTIWPFDLFWLFFTYFFDSYRFLPIIEESIKVWWQFWKCWKKQCGINFYRFIPIRLKKSDCVARIHFIDVFCKLLTEPVQYQHKDTQNHHSSYITINKWLCSKFECVDFYWYPLKYEVCIQFIRTSWLSCAVL